MPSHHENTKLRFRVAESFINRCSRRFLSDGQFHRSLNFYCHRCSGNTFFTVPNMAAAAELLTRSASIKVMNSWFPVSVPGQHRHVSVSDGQRISADNRAWCRHTLSSHINAWLYLTFSNAFKIFTSSSIVQYLYYSNASFRCTGYQSLFGVTTCPSIVVI